MIVKNIKTGKEYPITPEAWAKIKASGKKDAYAVVSAPETPKELKTVRASKKEKNAESDHKDGFSNINDRLPEQDAGEAE